MMRWIYATGIVGNGPTRIVLLGGLVVGKVLTGTRVYCTGAVLEYGTMVAPRHPGRPKKIQRIHLV